MYGSFLVYKETENKKSASKTDVSATAAADLKFKEGGMVKRALSVTTKSGRKQHLISYYSKKDIELGVLNIPSEISQFTSINIEADIYPEFAPETDVEADKFSLKHCDSELFLQQQQQQPQKSPIVIPNRLISIAPSSSSRAHGAASPRMTAMSNSSNNISPTPYIYKSVSSLVHSRSSSVPKFVTGPSYEDLEQPLKSASSNSSLIRTPIERCRSMEHFQTYQPLSTTTQNDVTRWSSARQNSEESLHSNSGKRDSMAIDDDCIDHSSSDSSKRIKGGGGIRYISRENSASDLVNSKDQYPQYLQYHQVQPSQQQQPQFEDCTSPVAIYDFSRHQESFLKSAGSEKSASTDSFNSANLFKPTAAPFQRPAQILSPMSFTSNSSTPPSTAALPLSSNSDKVFHLQTPTNLTAHTPRSAYSDSSSSSSYPLSASAVDEAPPRVGPREKPAVPQYRPYTIQPSSHTVTASEESSTGPLPSSNDAPVSFEKPDFQGKARRISQLSPLIMPPGTISTSRKQSIPEIQLQQQQQPTRQGCESPSASVSTFNRVLTLKNN